MSRVFFLEGKNFLYTRAQLLIWSAQGLNNPSIVQKSFVDHLTHVYENEGSGKVLILNFKRIKDIAAHCFDNFFVEHFLKINRPILLTECSGIQTSIMNTLKDKNVPFLSDPKYLWVGSPKEGVNPDLLIKDILEQENETINNIVGASFIKSSDKKMLLTSTPIVSNGEFDASIILRNPVSFAWVTIKLADLFEEIQESLQKESSEGGKFKYSKLKILAVSLRGSPFAAAVANLSNSEFDAIDHLGPAHKLFDNEFFENVQKGVLYIYLGDFVIGGTEIRIAQTYARIFECDLTHAIAIGSLLKPESYKKHFSLLRLVSLKTVEPTCEFTLS